MTSQSFELDLIPHGVPPVIHVSQYDRGQIWFIKVLENGTPYEIPSGCAVTIQGTKPDSTAFQYACVYSGSIVSATLMQQMCAVAGNVQCEVRITANDAAQIIGSLNFILEVEEASIADDTIISETDISLIEQAIELAERVPEIIQECEQYQINSEGFAEDAEAWANGTRNGTTITSGDEAYNKNSKYYATQAGNSATSASNSATNAATSEDNAEAWAVGQINGTDVASTASQYHNNSKYYAEQANTKAGNASTSASNAASSATLAESWAKGGTNTRTGEDTNNSSYFASQASTKATNAANSATLAESYAKGGTNTRTGEDTDNAKYYMEQAQAAAGGAGASDFTGATSSADGTHGLVPAPLIANRKNFLRGDGTWTDINPPLLGGGYATCDTAEATAAKVAVLGGYALVFGGIVSVKFTYAVPANATLNINNTGAKPIHVNSTNITAGIIKAGALATFVYSGSAYRLVAVDTCTVDILEGGVTKVTTPSFSSLPQTFSAAGITADYELVQNGFALLSTPSAQGSDWTITTGAGTITIAGTFSGSTATTVTMSLSIPRKTISAT